MGELNSSKYYAKQLRIMVDSDALKGNVLEVGPGEGNLAQQCRDAGLEYKGIERSPGLQARLAEQGFDVILGSAPPLPYADGQFNLVCAMAVVEHMPTFNEALQLLQECHRVLDPNGMLTIVVPDVLRAGPDFYNWDYTHSFMTTQYRVRQILGDSGFEVDRIVHMTGSLTGPIRIPIDLLGMMVHTRLIYWLGTLWGFESLLQKFHKTFEPVFVVIARKTSDSPTSSILGGLH